MLKKILIVLVIAIAAFLIYTATKPDTFRVERTVSIKAPPARIYAMLNDLHIWNTWSPFEKLDPNAKKTFSGADSGVGAVEEWDGNSKAGAGRMEITEASPSSKILIKLDFLKPFVSHNMAEFTLDSTTEGVNVTWAMYGPSPYIHKIMSTFFSMDKMVGGQFETGLGNLKALAEK